MGEGGAAVSKNKELINKIRKLSYFGINKNTFKKYTKTGSWFYDIEEMGYKANLDSIHAALGIVQLNKLNKMNFRRREIAKYYRDNFTDKLIFTKDSDEHHHTYHLFMAKLPDFIVRNDFIEELKNNNIGSSLHFIPLHMHTFYKNKYVDRFKTANSIFKNILSLPMCSAMSDNEVEYVVDTVNLLLRR